MRVWSKQEIKVALEDYLISTKQVDSDAWNQLSVEEQQVLRDYHFSILYEQLKRSQPKRKMAN